MKNTPVIEIADMHMIFPGVHALKGVSFDLYEGEVHALVGENGAGKSTLMKILFGMEVIRDTGGYDGDILLDGEKVSFRTPFDALHAGIGMVHQEFSLIPKIFCSIVSRRKRMYSPRCSATG